MAQYDGSIRINTQINTRGASAQLMTLENRIVKTADKIASLRSKMNSLKDAKIPTEEYQEVANQIAKAETEFNKLLEKQEQMQRDGKDNGVAWERLNARMEEVGNTIRYAQGELQDLVDTGRAFTMGSETEEYANLSQQLQYAENDLEVLTQRHDELEQRQNNNISKYRQLGNVAADALKKLSKSIYKFGIAPFIYLGKIAAKTFLGIGKSTKSSNNIFNKGFKAILKYGLGIRSLYILVNRLRMGIKEGFSNLYNDRKMADFKSQVDSLKASILTLKNAFAAAFRPIVEIAIPYIQRLIDYITQLLNVVGQFMAAITGQKSYTKAIKQTTAAIEDQNKVQNKQLSGLDKLNNMTSSSGGGGADSSAGGMFEEAPVDERWQDIAQWLKDMWDKSDFTDLGRTLGEKLKNALDNIPWEEIKEKARNLGKSLATLINGFIEVDGLGYSIGRTLAEAFNTGFEFLNTFVHELHWDSLGKFIAETLNGIFENIDWDLIYDTFVTGAKGLGDAINYFADNFNWGAIATTISNFVNTFVDTIYTFITTVNWKELGEKVGKTLSDAWTGINWGKAGETLGEYFKAFFDFIGKAIENVDWWAVGESVKDFLVGIDWAGVADSFFEAVGAIFGGFAAFIGGLISDGVEAAKKYFEGKIEEAGGNVVKGIFNGIIEAIKNIGSWINKHIFQPFITGFKNAFGIHSPSTVMEEMGTYIIQGLLDGITSLVDKVTEIWESMKEKALEIWENVKTGLSEKWESTKETAIEKWNDIKENLGTTWDTIKTTAETNFSAIRDYISDRWADTEDNTDSTWGRIRETVLSIASDVSGVVSSKFSEILSSFGGFSSGAQNTWANTWESIKNKLGSILSSIKDAVQSAFDWISDKISSITSKAGSAGSAIGGSLGSAIGDAIGGKAYSAVPQAIALSNMDFPGYATGQVIPTSMKKHLAWLGDNNHETEVVSPLSTIEEAVENAMLRVGGMGGGEITIKIPVEIDGRIIFELVKKFDLEQYRRTQKPSFQY